MPMSSTHVINTADATFQKDVIERSQEVPVVVDFWAAWCQPCRLLAPLLEKLADEYAGQFVLVKANTDETPQAATALNVQSIPAVFAFVGGQAVDFFAGLLPEEQLRQWLDRLLLAGRMQTAERLEVSDPAAAENLYREILSQRTDLAAATIGLGRVLLAQGQTEAAKVIVQQLEDRGFLEPEAQKLKAALELGEKKEVNLDQLSAKAQSAPDDLALQLELGEALAAHGEHEAALEKLLDLVARDKHGIGDQARQVMVDIFRILPDDSELTSNYRRQLSALLF